MCAYLGVLAVEFVCHFLLYRIVAIVYFREALPDKSRTESDQKHRIRERSEQQLAVSVSHLPRRQQAHAGRIRLYRLLLAMIQT